MKFHAKNIYQKLGVNSRKLVAEIARQHGVASPGSAARGLSPSTLLSKSLDGLSVPRIAEIRAERRQL